MTYALKLISLFCLTFVSSYLIADAILHKDPVTFFVEKEYRDSFAATCGVIDLSDVMFTKGGTGVLLNNGKILTAKHVPDNNRNGIIDENERDVILKFYYPKEFVCRGRVIFSPSEKNIIGLGFDFAVIKPELPIASNIRLQSRLDQHHMSAGQEIYTVGRKDGDTPTILFGNHTTKIQGPSLYDRAHLDIWYGNSGGGVFDKITGELVGVVSLKRQAQWGPTMWMGYIGAYNIRNYLISKSNESLVEYWKDTLDYKLKQAILYCLIVLNCFLGVYFVYPILCEEVWDMRRNDACV